MPTACSSVAAREETTGVEASVTVKPSYGLSDDEVTRMLGEGFGHAEDDMAARALREAQVDAERLLAAIASALAADGELLGRGARGDRARGGRPAGGARRHRSRGDRASLKALSRRPKRSPPSG